MKKSIAILSILFCAFLMDARNLVHADQVILDDLIVDGSTCVGNDCVNGESFGFDTLRLKENNLRIKAQDTSSTSSFPSNDWQLTFNDSSNGGLNKFSIDDIDGGRTPFTIEAGAPSHSLYVDDGGKIGLGTSTPVVDVHVKSGNTPTLRLEQDGSNGFAAQTWDVAGNEANFFIRDATNGSKLPFRIQPGATNASLYIASDGDVGFETTTPDGQFDVAHSANANNHAFLIDPSSNVGINIDNGQTPAGLFDVQTTGGVSRFTVASDGNVGVGTTAPAKLLHIVGTQGTTGNASTVGGKDWLVIENNNNANIAIVTSATARSGVKWYRDASGYKGAILYDNANTEMEFHVEGAVVGTLDASGNLVLNGTVTAPSDVNLKENITLVDGKEVLALLAEIPISTWNYKHEDPGIRHMGPMAQDFYAAYELGFDDRHITSLDPDGVALVAIQTLRQMSLEKDAKIAEHKAKNVELEARLASLEKLVEDLAGK